MSPTPQITLYTHPRCPYAQRVWIALEASNLPFQTTKVNLYSVGGFDKRALIKVEQNGGLIPPKGCVPVLELRWEGKGEEGNKEVIRESSVCVKRVVELLGKREGGQVPLLHPSSFPEFEEKIIDFCDDLPSGSLFSHELTSFLEILEGWLGRHEWVGGERFGAGDACVLPFLQRVEERIFGEEGREKGEGLENVRGYMKRMRGLDCFQKTIVEDWWWW